jgi:cytochrome P450
MFQLLLKALTFSVCAYAVQSLVRFAYDCYRGYSTYNGIKGPVRYPFGIGNLPQVLMNYSRLNDYFIEIFSQQFPGADVLYLHIPFTMRMVLCSSPADVELVLKTKFNSFEKGELVHSNFHQLFGNGIFATDGDVWLKQRKIASNIFTVSNFRDYFFEVVQEESSVLCSVLEKTDVVDLHDLFHRYTLDSFMRIGFGHELKSIVSDEHLAFSSAFNRSQTIVNDRFFNPFWRVTEVVTGQAAQMKQDIKTMDNFVYKIIKERRQSDDIEKKDLLSLFMEKEYDDKDLRDVVMNMIIAGRDTTAQALSWCFYELFKNPSVYAKLKQEITEVVQDSVVPSHDQVKELRYTKAVFQEALRLHPSVPKNTKVCIQTEMLPSGHIINAGDNFCWAPYGMARMESIWGKDASSFNPDRFLNDPNPSQYTYCVFNAGPRLCLGMNLAYLEAVTAIATILNKFDFEPVGDIEKYAEYTVGLTLPMRREFYVKRINA